MTTTMRFNITLPRELGLKLKKASNHSQLIAESLTEKFARDEKTRLEALLAEGYAASAREDAVLNAEWDVTVGDGID